MTRSEGAALRRLYRLKVIMVALVSLCVGIAMLVFSRYVLEQPSLGWLSVWPFAEIGGTLTTAGLFGVVWEYFDQNDKEMRADQRVRRLLRESAPAFRDAVIEGFSETPDKMSGVATNETLDKVATNALALRLGDEQFAREIYADVRDQAIRAPERWHNVEINVRLSSALERNAEGVPLFDVLVEWEYDTAPSHPIARFACVSDRDEFYELTTDVPTTSTWFMTPRPGLDSSKRECFELLSYSINGEEKKIRRSERKTGQTYSVTLGEDLVREGRPVRVRHLYRVVTPQFGHRLFFEVPQPARDVSMSVDYTNAGISTLSISELVTSIQKPRVARLPVEAVAKVVQVDIDGWLLPRAGFTCVWTLESEIPSAARTITAQSGATTSSRRADAA